MIPACAWPPMVAPFALVAHVFVKPVADNGVGYVLLTVILTTPTLLQPEIVFVAVKVYCWFELGFATGLEMALLERPIDGVH